VIGVFFILFVRNGRYIDYLSLTYATNKNKVLTVRYKYYKQNSR